MKRNILVWDLPTRLFHGLLAGSFLGAYAIALLIDDDSTLFVLHMLLGAVAAFIVVLRIVWGIIGSRYARFGSFVFGPAAVVAYVKGIISQRGERHVGHNPGSSVAIFVMLALTLGVATSGVLLARYGDSMKEVHELLAHSLAAVTAVHVAGVLAHTLRKRDGIVLAMVDGKKAGASSEGIASSHPAVALTFLALTAIWGVGLVRSYDAASGALTIPILGQRLQLHEIEDEDEGGRRGRASSDRDDDDDD